MPTPLLVFATRRSTCPKGFVPLLRGSNRDSLCQPDFTGEGGKLPTVAFVDDAKACLGTINHHVFLALCRHRRTHGLHWREEQQDDSVRHCNDVPAPLFIRST